MSTKTKATDLLTAIHKTRVPLVKQHPILRRVNFTSWRDCAEFQDIAVPTKLTEYRNKYKVCGKNLMVKCERREVPQLSLAQLVEKHGPTASAHAVLKTLEPKSTFDWTLATDAQRAAYNKAHVNLAEWCFEQTEHLLKEDIKSKDKHVDLAARRLSALQETARQTRQKLIDHMNAFSDWAKTYKPMGYIDALNKARRAVEGSTR